MSVSVERSAIVLTLLLGALAVSACKASSNKMAQPDAGSPDFAQAPPDPLAELDRLEGRMRELGLAPAPVGEAVGVDHEAPADDRRDAKPVEEKVGPGEGGELGTLDDKKDLYEIDATVSPEPGPPPTAVSERDQPFGGASRCTSVCELSEAICELEVRICSMAKNHDGDPTYVNACERAVDDCELSGDACDTCVE